MLDLCTGLLTSSDAIEEEFAGFFLFFGQFFTEMLLPAIIAMTSLEIIKIALLSPTPLLL